MQENRIHEILKIDEKKAKGSVEQTRTMMERQLQHLVRLVDDLLDVSRISRGKLELRKERVELASVLHQSIEACRPLAESAEHKLLVSLPPEPIYLCADQARLAQVFGNLLNKTGTTPNNYLYRGEQYDSDLGLYYLRARYYNPLTGRFLSRDPNDPQLIDANEVPTDPKYLHKYLYANGDPINGTDPEGRAAYIESIFSEPVDISSPLETRVAEAGYTAAKAFCFIAKTLARATLGVPPGMSHIPGPPEWPGPVAAVCKAFGF